MSFGMKILQLQTRGFYTIETLYEAIKDKKFSAGEPSLTKHGLVYVITFPALDDRNQVWIMHSGFGKETNKFQVQKQEKAGMGNAMKNSALDGLTKGFAGMGRMVGSNAKECERLVEATAQELNALGL